MAELMSKIGNLANRLREGFMELSPRDRALLSGMGVLFTGAALGGSIWWMDSREAALASKVEAHKQSVALIKAHIDTFQTDSTKAATCEAKLVAHKGTSLNAFLSTVTDKQKLGDKDKISELPSSRDTELETMRGKLAVRDLTVQEMLRLVEAIETDPFPVQIDLLEVTTKRVIDKDQPKVDDEPPPKKVVVNASLELTAFALKDVEPGAAP